MTQDPGIQVSIALKLASALAFGWRFKLGPPQPWRS
jgi:hypothetical protein